MKSNKKQNLCIIPAKGTSQRFPSKNKQLFMGKPLFVHAIEASLKSNIFSEICLSSEDKEILSIASNFPITTIKRPYFLSEEAASIKDVCLDLIKNIKKDFETFSVIIPTSPLRKAKQIQEAYSIFKHNNAKALMSVTLLTHPPQRALKILNNKRLEPFLGMEYLKQTQKLEPLYIHDGTIIIAKTNAFIKAQGFYELSPIAYIIDHNKTVDIDTYMDLKWAEFLAK